MDGDVERRLDGREIAIVFSEEANAIR